jgi:hypothetical protein
MMFANAFSRKCSNSHSTKDQVCFEKRLQTLFLSCQAKNQQFLGTPYKTYTAQNDFELLQHIIILNLI